MQIYILRNNEQKGPYDESQLATLLERSEVSYDDLGWHKGMEEWLPLRRIIGHGDDSGFPVPLPPVDGLRVERRKPLFLHASAAFWISILCAGIAAMIVFYYTPAQPHKQNQSVAGALFHPGEYSGARIESLFTNALNDYMAAIADNDLERAARYSFSIRQGASKSAAQAPLIANLKIGSVQTQRSSEDCYLGTAKITFEADRVVLPNGKSDRLKSEVSVIGYTNNGGKTWRFLGVASPEEWNWLGPLTGNTFQIVGMPREKLSIFQNGTWVTVPDQEGSASVQTGGPRDDTNRFEFSPDKVFTTLRISTGSVYALRGGRWQIQGSVPGWISQPIVTPPEAEDNAAKPPDQNAGGQAGTVPPASPPIVEPSFTSEILAVKKAAESGNPRALGIMAVLWESGFAGAVDEKSASNAALASVNQSSPFGQYALARIYNADAASGKTNTKSQELGKKALEGLKSYADSNDAWAEMFIGSLIELGIGVPRDPGEAIKWYRKSSGHGNSLAEMSLAKALMSNNPAASSSATLPANLSVLILGDSMSLCGFGKSLDQRFRNSPQVKSAFTYMACGTNPLSWLQARPYANITTNCGFWSIESMAGSKQPREMEDTYGMKRGYAPTSHPVPKLNKLLATAKPDILIMQCGTNLFDLFQGRSTVKPYRDGPMLKSYILPFMSAAINSSSSLRRIYWVASPTSGRVSREIQDFVFEQIRACTASAATVIDSRLLVSYPYKRMQPDHEHFIGADMDHWADRVFDIIQQDLSSQPLSALHLLKDLPPPTATGEPKKSVENPKNELVCVDAKLAFKSKPYDVKELMPYQESLVSFVYDVTKVVQGQYTEKQILVVHPAHIGLKKQPLDNYNVGKTYTLQVHELEGSLWHAVKCKDDSNLIDLLPYIQLDDENKFPGGGTH